MFQSSPDPCGPGVPRFANNSTTTRRFNPRPTLAGRASPEGRVFSLRSSVSILARPLRAGRPSWPSGRRSGRRFQSSPDPCGPGVDDAIDMLGDITKVSILARPLRAGSRRGFTAMTAAFQSSPDPCGPGVSL